MDKIMGLLLLETAGLTTTLLYQVEAGDNAAAYAIATVSALLTANQCANEWFSHWFADEAIDTV